MHLFIRHCTWSMSGIARGAGTQRWKWSQPLGSLSAREDRRVNRLHGIYSPTELCTNYKDDTNAIHTCKETVFGGVYIWARLPSINRYSSGEWGCGGARELEAEGLVSMKHRGLNQQNMGKLFIRDLFWLKNAEGRGKEAFSTSPASVSSFSFPLPYPRKVTLWFVEIIARAWNWSHCLQLPPPRYRTEYFKGLAELTPLTVVLLGRTESPSSLPPRIWGWLWRVPPVPWHGRFPGHCPPLSLSLRPQAPSWTCVLPPPFLCPCQSHWPGCPSLTDLHFSSSRVSSGTLDLAGIGSILSLPILCQVLNRFWSPKMWVSILAMALDKLLRLSFPKCKRWQFTLYSKAN